MHLLILFEQHLLQALWGCLALRALLLLLVLLLLFFLFIIGLTECELDWRVTDTAQNALFHSLLENAFELVILDGRKPGLVQEPGAVSGLAIGLEVLVGSGPEVLGIVDRTVVALVFGPGDKPVGRCACGLERRI